MEVEDWAAGVGFEMKCAWDENLRVISDHESESKRGLQSDLHKEQNTLILVSLEGPPTDVLQGLLSSPTHPRQRLSTRPPPSDLRSDTIPHCCQP